MIKRFFEAVKSMLVIEEKVNALQGQLSSASTQLSVQLGQVEKRLDEKIAATREVLEVKHDHLKGRVDHLQVSVDAILSELRLFRGDMGNQVARLTERVVDLTLDVERRRSSKS